jgi:hypothetical protein
MLEIPKRVIRSRKSKNIQYNGKKKKTKGQTVLRNTTQKTEDWAT